MLHRRLGEQHELELKELQAKAAQRQVQAQLVFFFSDGWRDWAFPWLEVISQAFQVFFQRFSSGLAHAWRP